MFSKSVVLAVCVIACQALPSAGEAGAIRNACLKAGRPGATPAVCSCIQSVANSELTRTDRRLASKLFLDPQRAQDIRQSDRRNHEEFWERYRAFGEAARKTCT